MMSYKTHPPVVPPGIVRRERLFALLDQRGEKPLFWISGPGGSGKTTLVSSYLQMRGVPALWYQVDSSDADPASFFYYMAAAFKNCVPHSQVSLPLLTPEYFPGIATFARNYFHELFAQLPVPSVIVLDNYQDVSANSPLHALLLEGLSQIPEGITVIALSRSEPPPILTTRDSVLRMKFLGWNDLRFSFEEAGEFATQTERSLDPAVLARLYSKTDGWIAGLVLILESLQGSELDFQVLEKLPLDKVFDYFANKILDSSDSELLELLLKTSFAPGITARMAQQLTGIQSSEQILSRLCRNRFFTANSSPDDPVYEYHPLFREFLRARAERTYRGDQLRAIKGKTASLLQDAGRIEEAADLLADAADWESLTELILKSAPMFASEGRSETLLSWLESIPPDILEGTAGLLYWQGVCQLLHPPIRSRDYYRKAFELYSAAGDQAGVCLSWAAGAEVSLYDGDFTRLDEWLALLDRMHIDEASFPSAQMKVQVSMSIYNALAFRQPQHPDISRWRERGAPVVHSKADINFRLQSAVQLLVHDLWNGNFARATFMLEQVQGIAHSRTLSPMTDITIRNSQALHAFLTGAWEVGVAAAVDAVRVADEIGLHVLDCQLLGNGASCAISMGDLSTASELEGMLRRRLGGGWNSFDHAYFHLLCGWRKSHQNDFAAAAPHLEQALQGFKEAGFRAVEVMALNFMAENLRERGERGKARDYLSQATELASGMKSGFLEFLCLLTSVHLALDEGRTPQAVSLLGRAMSLGRAGGYVGTWLSCPSSLLRLCLKALEHDIEVDYVRGLIVRWALVPAVPPLHLDAWPWRIKIYTLGGFQLWRDGEPTSDTGKVRKPLELLKLLISLGGNSVSVESLCDTLWPDADGDLAQRSFDTTLHRLRKLLGHEKALQLQAGRLSLDPRYCWLDIWAFERNCDEVAEALRNRGELADLGRFEALIEKCAVLYRGRYLPTDPNLGWTSAMRGRLSRRYLGYVTAVADYFASLGQWEQAVVWYQRGLGEEGVAEELKQRLAHCLKQQEEDRGGSC